MKLLLLLLLLHFCYLGTLCWLLDPSWTLSRRLQTQQQTQKVIINIKAGKSYSPLLNKTNYTKTFLPSLKKSILSLMYYMKTSSSKDVRI